MKTVLVAVGGNALFDAKGGNNIDPASLDTICQELVKVVQLGYQPIITFGNGPQVGNLLEMAEKHNLPPKWPISLDTCVAWTQAEIGYFLTKALHNHLRAAGFQKNLIEVNTTVVVDENDPAFLNATKPVGHFFSKAEANTLSKERGWEMKQDSNRGYRRVVPSPRPLRVVEETAIRHLVEGGCLVLCGGGGGIPVMEDQGNLVGVEAVIDKDYTACLLATRLKIEELVICTAVEQVYLNFGTPEAKALSLVTVPEARQYLEEGHFPAGSMGPKVDALIGFVEAGGKRAMLTRLETLSNGLQGQTGTRFVQDSEPSLSEV